MKPRSRKQVHVLNTLVMWITSSQFFFDLAKPQFWCPVEVRKIG